ncbi:hypothetical protein [Pedobacter psychrodurus]|nr:hypothetical protein [Pedobacter psychrodurus]
MHICVNYTARGNAVSYTNFNRRADVIVVVDDIDERIAFVF